jgi:hypothetical protein
MSGFSRTRYEHGVPPAELWGVAQRNRGESRTRSDAAAARRKVKRIAQAMRMPLKEYLAAHEFQARINHRSP